jgi:preprotein translocase subunit YajC
VNYLAATNDGDGGSLAGLIFPLLLVGLLALLFFSQRRRSRAVQEVQRQLRPGMNVMTTAGLFAEVQAVEDDAVHLEIAPGVVCRFARASVARVVDAPGDEPMELGADTSEDDLGSGLLDRNDGDPDRARGPNDGPPPPAPAT